MDAAGAPFALPEPARRARARRSSATGGRWRCSCTTPAVAEERELVTRSAAPRRSRSRTSGSAAELRANLKELRASRARIVESADAARRRIERDLHDGAQQQLVAVALQAAARPHADRARPGRRRRAARRRGARPRRRDPRAARARPRHPPGRALRPRARLGARGAGRPDAAAGRDHRDPEERLPEPIEAAAYFVVAEAITNVARYAEATTPRWRSHARTATWSCASADDGVGGADPARLGLRGLADRVAALDGRLEVASPPGDGTTVRALIPS